VPHTAYALTGGALSLHGLSHVRPDAQEYWRLPPSVIDRLPEVYERLGKRPAGARVRFATDAAELTVRFTLLTESVDPYLALPGSAGADVYLGRGPDARYAGTVAPAEYGFRGVPVEKRIITSSAWETVTVNLPRNEQLGSFEVDLPDGARVRSADPFRVPDPIVFYGSSITEGGCAPRPGAAYTSVVARWLDADHYNYGFSGSARGEQAMADHIAGHPAIGAFVLDYDHNAPSVEHLAQTHLRFFETFREAHPEVPVLMLSRPDTDKDPRDAALRRDVVLNTFRTARARGDRRVWFLDGHELFGSRGRAECTVDGCHPNALGFHRMARSIHAVLSRALQECGGSSSRPSIPAPLEV
jgi:hypothetical protein